MASYLYHNPDEEGERKRYCTCCRFTNGIDLPAPNDELLLPEIKVKAIHFSTQIFCNWTRLNAVLKRFEPTIQKRWQKKTQQQRASILVQAYPGIPRQHRPDFVGCKNRKRRARTDILYTRQSAAFLLPYINLEDLQQGHLLPLYLHSRGRELPEKFIATDLQGAHRGHGWVDTVEDGKSCMAFAGGKSPRKYGRVFLQRGNVKQRVLRPTFAPIVGLFILEIQDSIYRFLISCAEKILHDVDEHALFLAPSLPAPDAPTPDEKRQQWNSLPALALETPYRAPQQLDVDGFQTLVSAKRTVAEDHVWLLREDPGYLLDCLKDRMEHSHERIDRQTDTEHMYKHVAGKVLADAFTSFYLWDELDHKLLLLPPIEIQLQDANLKNGRLLPYDEITWALLEAIIEKLIDVHIATLRIGVPMSPLMRAFSDVELSEDGQNWEMKANRTDAEYRVYVLFWALFDKDQRSLHGLNALVQEIQHLLDDPEASELLDSWVVEHFSDVALLSELQRGIDSFQPWARGWRLNKVSETSAVIMTLENAFARDYAHHDSLAEAPCHLSSELGNPLDGRFHYPDEKKRTRDTVDQMRRAETFLAHFWAEINKMFRQQNDRSLFDEFSRKSFRKEGVRKTRKWVEPRKSIRELAAPASPPATPLLLTEKDTNTWHGGSGSVNKKRELIDTATKSKVKTRGEAAQLETPPGTPCRAPDAEETPIDLKKVSRPPIRLPKRAYRVFATLLPSAETIGHAGREISWDDFCSAMNTIGLQPEKLYGSVWIFRPAKAGSGGFKSRRGKAATGMGRVGDERSGAAEDGSDERGQDNVRYGLGGLGLRRSIQIHEPKQVRNGSKIPKAMVKTIARRLKYAYDWEGGMFECE